MITSNQLYAFQFGAIFSERAEALLRYVFAVTQIQVDEVCAVPQRADFRYFFAFIEVQNSQLSARLRYCCYIVIGKLLALSQIELGQARIVPNKCG